MIWKVWDVSEEKWKHSKPNTLGDERELSFSYTPSDGVGWIQKLSHKKLFQKILNF